MTLQIIQKSAETKLVQMIGEVRDQPYGWMAVHFHLSDLMEEYKSEYQIKIALNLIYDLLKLYEGCIYVMQDHSIIVLVYQVEPPLLEKLIFQLRYLYMDDPLCYNEAGEENPAFSHIYDIRRNGQTFYELGLQYMALATRNKPVSMQPSTRPTPIRETLETTVSSPAILPTLERADAAKPAFLSRPVISASPRPFDNTEEHEDKSMLSASNLVSIERSLRTLNLQGVIRRQPVCAVLQDLKVRRVFDELYIHISQLRNALRSEVDFFSNRWLFKYMTQLLDKRMIELLRTNQSTYLTSPISINLNMETLLSNAFSEFDASLTSAQKVSIVIEIPVVDMFADMHGFKAAVAEVQKLGYRVCLDGLSTESITCIDRTRLGLDLVKVQWSAEIAKDMQSPENATTAEAIQNIGNNRIILCRCDNRSALEFGKTHGISLFQGRFLDNLLNPTSKVEN